MHFKANDTVKLLRDLPQEALAKGAVGVIVAEFNDPEEAYEVEFCNERGETIAQVALLPNQLTLIH
jgi:hypothetical protein